MSRLFTHIQKEALYWVAGGKCERCGQVLQKDWHADHIVPYCAGGSTDVANGQALCPECNRRKGKQMRLPEWPYPLRTWQEEFATKYIAEEKSDFLLVATPGAGKTIASLRIAYTLLIAGAIKRVVIVCPSDHLRTQWLDDAAATGINVDKLQFGWTGEIAVTSDFVGVVTTYQQVDSRREELRVFASREDTLVIFDEIHHCGDEDTLSWGRAIKHAFDKARFRLLLSGTPFRSDNNPIPFVTYQTVVGNSTVRQSVADYAYGYGHALKDDGVVRHIVFPSWDGYLVWENFGEKRQATFRDDLSRTDAAHRLRTAIEPKGDWLRRVIESANTKLDAIRKDEGHSNAGGLIVAKDQEAAKQIADVVKVVTGEQCILVISEDENASAEIKRFKKGTQKWIVSVKMVSEGVDIKRLRVGVFATNVMTATFFRQVIGRVIRWDSDWNHLDDQVAWFYLPEDPGLVQLAKEIRDEITHTITEQETDDKELRKSGEGAAGQLSLTGEANAYEFQSSEGQESDHVYYGESFTQDDLSEARIRMNFPGFEKLPDAALAYAWRHIKSTQQISNASPTKVGQSSDGVPAYQRKEDLKVVIKKKVGRLAHLCQQKGIRLAGKSPHQAINTALGRRYGYSREASVAELEEKITWLESMIANALNENWSFVTDINQ